MHVNESQLLRDEPKTAEDALAQLMMTVGRRFRARLDGDTIDPSQAALLYTLKCRGAMRLSDIADAMKLDASTVSRHVQQLGDREFIERGPDPEDGRASIISLTDEGRSGLKFSFEQRRAILAEALADWNDQDREQLRIQLSRLATALGDHA
jgi:DNA-binding MarR family transcriptional regulator